MKYTSLIVLTVALLIGMQSIGFAQEDAAAEIKKDAKPFDNKFGAGLSYTGISLIESAVIGLQFRYTMKHHAVALGTHIAYHDLFGGQSDWERYGLDFTYEYFPIRSNRLFSPFLFYDLSHAYSKSRRDITATTEDGMTNYSAVRQVTMNGLSHHLGIGARVNMYKGLFLHLSAGGGPGTYGESVRILPNQSQFAETKAPESPFANYQTVFTFRVGLTYQLGISELKKGNDCNCL